MLKKTPNICKVTTLSGLMALLMHTSLYASDNESLLTPPISGAPASIQDPVERGKYLSHAADCAACHTGNPDQPYAGSLPFKLPFGTLYSTNITSSKEYGIGNWTDDQFVDAVLHGKGSHGNLYPAMPYTSYTAMSRDDVLSIKTFLLSLPAVDVAPTPNGFGFPFNQRWGITFWNLFFFKDQRFQVQKDQSAVWNRGAYVTNALGHCGECHTPRNLAFAMDTSQWMAGTTLEGWYASNLTPDKASGLGDWSDEQLANYLATGHAKGKGSAGKPMAQVIELSTQHMTKDDIYAMVTYLRSIKPINNRPESAVNDKPAMALASKSILPAPLSDKWASNPNMKNGQMLFANECAGCHAWNGDGRQSAHAELLGSRSVNDPEGYSLTQVILKGTQLTVKGQKHEMPGFAGSFSDKDIADLSNYVIAQFGDKDGKVTESFVAKQRKQ